MSFIAFARLTNSCSTARRVHAIGPLRQVPRCLVSEVCHALPSVSSKCLFRLKTQLFIHLCSLFAPPKMNEVTLEEAGKYLVPDSQEDQFYVSVSHSANPKSEPDSYLNHYSTFTLS